MRAAREPQCAGQPLLVIAQRDAQLTLLKRAFASYRTQPPPLILGYPSALTTLASASPASLGDPVCVIAEFAERREDSNAAFEALGRLFPDLIRPTETDLSGYHLVPLLSPPHTAR